MVQQVGREGVPGVWDEGGWREGLYRVLPRPHPGTHIQSYSGLRPYLRPYEGNSRLFDEVSQTGSRIDSELTSD